MQRLRMLGTERLVRCRSTSADNGHRHLELTTGGGVRVARRRDLRNTVDAEVGIHQLDDRAVAVHSFPERLANEMALVNNFVRCAKTPKRLLRELRDVVRRA